MAKVTITRDDLTGRESTETAETKITLNGKSHTLDLTAESVQAITEFLDGSGTAALARLLAPPQPVKAAAHGSRRTARTGTADSENAAARAWAHATGYLHDGKPFTAVRGRLPAEVRDAWIAAGRPAVSDGQGAAQPASTAADAS